MPRYRCIPSHRLGTLCLVLCCAFALAGGAFAELQNVELDGEIRMRGRHYHNSFNVGMQPQQRIAPGLVLKRPLGPFGSSSLYDYESEVAFYETAVLLGMKADMTDNVSAYIQFYDFYTWGTEFTSNYITGQDWRHLGQSVVVQQGYIDVDELFGQPLRLRVGRQALKFGKGWLVTDMTTPTQRLSFDGLRLTYETDKLTFDAFATKLFESGSAEIDGDVDFYGLYSTWEACEAFSLSPYYFLLRDARSRNTGTTMEMLGLLDYDPTYLHTVGLRAFGGSHGWDYDLELAYQFGNADAVGAGFVPVGGGVGDDSARFDAWAGELEVGYTLSDIRWAPRLYVQGAYFEGEDNRDITFLDYINPFYRPTASVSFNRLFTDINYMPAANDNGWMTNMAQVQAGLEVKPTEKTLWHTHVARDWVVAPFDHPRFPLTDLSFLTREGSDDIGWEIATFLSYKYNENLTFLLYYNHLFADDGLTEGAYTMWNGLSFSGGTASNDIDYMFWMAILKF